MAENTFSGPFDSPSLRSSLGGAQGNSGLDRRIAFNCEAGSAALMSRGEARFISKEAVRWYQNEGDPAKQRRGQVSHPAHKHARVTSGLALRGDSGWYLLIRDDTCYCR